MLTEPDSQQRLRVPRPLCTGNTGSLGPQSDPHPATGLSPFGPHGGGQPGAGASGTGGGGSGAGGGGAYTGVPASGSGDVDVDVRRMIDHLQGLYSGVMTEVQAFRAEIDRWVPSCQPE